MQKRRCAANRESRGYPVSEKGQASEQEYEAQMQLATLALTTEFYFDYYQRSLQNRHYSKLCSKKQFDRSQASAVTKTRTQQNYKLRKIKSYFRK